MQYVTFSVFDAIQFFLQSLPEEQCHKGKGDKKKRILFLQEGKYFHFPQFSFKAWLCIAVYGHVYYLALLADNFQTMQSEVLEA